MPTVILSVDIGTSSLKAGLIDKDGRLHASSHQHYPSSVFGQQPWKATWWDEAFTAACQELQTANHPAIEGIVISGHGPTLVPMSQSNEAIGSAALWIEEPTPQIAGNPSVFLPKARYLTQTASLPSQPAWLATCPEYLVARLTGQRWTVIPHNAYRPYYWDPQQCAAYGLASELFASFAFPGHYLGEVGAGWAGILSPGLPVFGGGSDFLMSLIGAAAIEPGICVDRAGSSEGVNLCTDRRIDWPGLQTYPHAVENHWNLAGILNQSGLMFEWFRKITGQSAVDYTAMMEAVEGLDDSADLPIFLPQTNPGSYNFQGGVFWGLQPQHGPAHISRAVVEHLGLAVREVSRKMAAAGWPIRELRASGGQAKNAVWCQMKADITGLTIAIPRVIDTELVGCAAYGFIGLGHYTSLADATQGMVHWEKYYQPNLRRTEHFRKRQDQVHNLVGQLATLPPITTSAEEPSKPPISR